MTEDNLGDYPPGTIVFTSARMDSGELRETFYVRDPDRPCRYPCNVPVGRFGMIQGDPLTGSKRVMRMSMTPCRDPGEADSRTPCYPIEESVFWTELT